jgi:hypothetical protein
MKTDLHTTIVNTLKKHIVGSKHLKHLGCAALLGFVAAAQLQAEEFGIKFLGGAPTDLVTGTAGVVPIPNWNNITNGGFPVGTWTNITSSDGLQTAALSLSGGAANNQWLSSLPGDGANLSLLDGYIDTGYNGNHYVVATISNLTSASYDVYVYFTADNPRPENNGDWMPNYTVNGTSYYVPIFGAGGGTSYDTSFTTFTFTFTGFNGFVEAFPILTNNNSWFVATNIGNYLKIASVAPVGGVITVGAEEDVKTFRSPLNGIELVAAAPSAPLANAPTEFYDSVPGGSGQFIPTPGSNLTITASASGAAPITYQWQTDGGSGNAPTNIPGATSANLVINTAGWAPGSYVYSFVASNSLGTNASTTVSVLVPVTSPLPSISVQFEGNGNSQTLYPGQAAGYVPHQFWNIDNEASAGTMSNLVNSAGVATDASVSVTYHNGQYYSDDITTNGDGVMMSGGYWSGSGYIIDVTGVPYSSYNVYLYMLNDDNPNRRYGFTLGDQTYWGAVFDGNGYGVPPFTLDTQTEELPEGTQSQATLVEFTGISGSSFTINGTTPDGNVALMGMEIVNPDEGAVVADQIRLSPSGQTIYAGLPVELTEIPLSGLTPFGYQWLTDGGTGGALLPIAGATNSTLAVNTATFSTGAYNYEVIVTNSLGMSTSAVLAVNITASAPLVLSDISPQPTNECYIAETTEFSTAFGGTLPITYTWYFNNGSGAAPISAALNPSAATSVLVITNVQSANVGSYYVVASNSLGTNVSSTAMLTALTDLAPPAAGTFGALVLSESPVAYWRLNETEDPSTGILPAYDASGHNLDGVYGLNTENGFNNIAGPQPSSGFPGFEANNTALQTENASPGSYVQVPALNLNTNTVTISMWINPSISAPQVTFSGLFFFRNAANTDAAGLGFGGTENAGMMPALSYTWNSNNAATENWDSGLFPLEGQWSFVSLVITPADATIYLYYIDPITSQPDLFSASNPLTNGVETFSDGTNVIGSDPYDFTTRSFNGDIDEVAVFNQALTSTEILAMFTKAAGLTGAIAPQISGQPVSIGSLPGKTVTFSATGINGTTPFTYQWEYITATATNKLTDGGNISGSTSNTLTITDVAAGNSGSYQLIVSNSAGFTNSSVATLNVAAPVVGSYEAAAMQYSPVAFWPLNETTDPSTGTAQALEYVNFYNGTYGVNCANGFDGTQGPEAPEFTGFPTINTSLSNTYNIANSYVTASTGSTVLMATNLTYAMWINPDGPVENWAGLLMDRGGIGNGFGFGGVTDTNGVSELVYTWNQNNGNTWDFNSYLYPAIGEWSFVAVTIEPTKATLYLVGTNGVLQSAVNAIPHDSEQVGISWHIGDDGGGTGGRTFPGDVSSVSVYLTALSAYQITTLADAGLGLTPPPPPIVINIGNSESTPGSLTLSWSAGTLLEATNLLGPWVTNTAPSPYTVAPTNSHEFFKVVQ